MNEFMKKQVKRKWYDPKPTHDVISIGGGNSGRNSTVIRANYGIPEAVKFYQHSLCLRSYGLLQTESAV